MQRPSPHLASLLALASLFPALASCAEEPAPPRPPAVVENGPEDPAPPTRPRRTESSGFARGTLASGSSLQSFQKRLNEASKPQKDWKDPRTPEGILAAYEASALYSETTALVDLRNDLASLERRAKQLERRLSRLENDAAQARAGSSKANALQRELRGYRAERDGHLERAKLLREALGSSR